MVVENNRIYNTEWESFEKDLKADLIITDPPYGIGYFKNVFPNADLWVSLMSDHLKENSHCYIYIPTLQADKWIKIVKKYLNFNNILACDTHTKNVYFKNNFCFDAQYILFASKGKAKRLNKVDWVKTSKAWYKDSRNPDPKEYTYQYPSFIPKEYKANVKPNGFKKRYHPNQKSEKLIEKFILLSSEPRELVLDPFVGSASTLRAAKRLGRNYIGFEKDPEVFKTAKERLQNASIKRVYKKEEEENFEEWL